jgi:serine/threonine protein kinase
MTAMSRTVRSSLIQPGQSFGKFYLVQTIGEGGTSRIFKALQQPINRLVALKIPSFAEAESILTPDEFLSEATLMARLEHPNVVRIYDFGVHEDKAFICMEYVEGWNLLELCQIRRALPLAAVLAIGIQTLEGILHSHSQGVLHLDLSPANVLISKSGTVKLLDFGMAGKKPTQGQGKVIGTPAFLSPEHVLGKAGTPQSDLFSFGSLLYFASTGESLFDPGEENTKVAGMLQSIVSAREHPPEDKLKRLPQVLARIIMNSLTGSEAGSLANELKAAWTKLEETTSPPTVLLRELDLDLPVDFSLRTETNQPTDIELRERYLHLREAGRHREAVALLEKALRRQPDNPLWRELLATPPAKANSTPATMAVTGPLESKISLNSSNTALSKSKAPSSDKKLFPVILGMLVVALGYLFWDKFSAPRANPITGNTPIAENHLNAEPTASVKVVSTSVTPERGTISPPVMATVKESNLRPIRKNPSLIASHRPPALALTGPIGTKVSLNDSVEWTSPSPKEGWILEPGLINLTLTLPGSSRPINSSLFISADSLYHLRVEQDGGFSVTREHR